MTPPLGPNDKDKLGDVCCLLKVDIKPKCIVMSLLNPSRMALSNSICLIKKECTKRLFICKALFVLDKKKKKNINRIIPL